MGRVLWAHLQVDGRRTLSSDVPFWIQTFHRLKLAYLREERLGVQSQLYTPFTTSEMECGFPHRLQGDLRAAHKGGLQQGCRTTFHMGL